MATIDESDRKLIKNWLQGQIDALKVRKQRLKNEIDNFVKADYENNDQEQVYNKDADTYKADLDAQLLFIQTQIDRLQNIKQWLMDLTL